MSQSLWLGLPLYILYISCVDMSHIGWHIYYSPAFLHRFLDHYDRGNLVVMRHHSSLASRKSVGVGKLLFSVGFLLTILRSGHGGEYSERYSTSLKWDIYYVHVSVR